MLRTMYGVMMRFNAISIIGILVVFINNVYAYMTNLVGQLGYVYNGDRLCSHIGEYMSWFKIYDLLAIAIIGIVVMVIVSLWYNYAARKLDVI